MQVQLRTQVNGFSVGRRVAVAIQEVFGVPIGDFLGYSRQRRYMPARRTFYIVMRDLGCSLQQIAKAAGRNDHTTVHYGLNLGAYEMGTDEAFRMKVNRVRLIMGIAEGRDSATRQDAMLGKHWDRLPLYRQVIEAADKDDD